MCGKSNFKTLGKMYRQNIVGGARKINFESRDEPFAAKRSLRAPSQRGLNRATASESVGTIDLLFWRGFDGFDFWESLGEPPGFDLDPTSLEPFRRSLPDPLESIGTTTR
jgi:hypothetical protein